MKGELLDNNKKKNMNIRLEDEREKNKKKTGSCSNWLRNGY